LNKKVNYYKHRISYLTGTCYNFELNEIFGMVLRRAGLSASAELSCCIKYYNLQRPTQWYAYIT